ncbi:MAG: CGNR zinc finger domain-containing protein [Chloroflexi bacterium]|nr:CGNR zinc finger domain-containing protein [Chloroflexota bacterium]
MKQPNSEAEKQHLVAGVLCLNFANTLYGHGKTPIHEYLFGYPDLTVWCSRVGIVSKEHSAYLMRLALRQPNVALSVFHRAIALRETIFRVFTAVADARPPLTADISALDSARTEALAHSRVVAGGKGYSVEWPSRGALDRLLWPISLSAVDLLVSPDLDRVRHCAGCDWLFLDTSRNHMRRWCSMSVCGNRAKVRRYLARKRTLASTE